MTKRKRRERFTLGWVIVLSACLATSLVGCDRVVRVGGLEITLPSPDPVTQELSRRRHALDDLLERLADPDRRPVAEVILRLSLTGGWGLPRAGGLHLTIEDDGRVVRVTDTTVFSSTRDYTSLRIDQAGMLRVLRMIEPMLPARRGDLDGGAGVSPDDRSAWLVVGDAITLSMDRIGQTDGYTSNQRAWRARFGDVLERIEDLGWLGDAIVEPQAPWIPESMTVLAGSRSAGSVVGPDPASAPWPLDGSITDLAVGTALDPAGDERLVLCLTGDEVAPVFALLTGLNHASLRVDDGAMWELDVRPHYPGYRLAGDPCP
jgi:hypothetical protein